MTEFAWLYFDGFFSFLFPQFLELYYFHPRIFFFVVFFFFFTRPSLEESEVNKELCSALLQWCLPTAPLYSQALFQRELKLSCKIGWTVEWERWNYFLFTLDSNFIGMTHVFVIQIWVTDNVILYYFRRRSQSIMQLASSLSSNTSHYEYIILIVHQTMNFITF